MGWRRKTEARVERGRRRGGAGDGAETSAQLAAFADRLGRGTSLRLYEILPTGCISPWGPAPNGAPLLSRQLLHMLGAAVITSQHASVDGTDSSSVCSLVGARVLVVREGGASMLPYTLGEWILTRSAGECRCIDRARLLTGMDWCPRRGHACPIYSVSFIPKAESKWWVNWMSRCIELMFELY